MKIYTRTGDDGTTGLFSGERIAKTAPRIEAHGAIDELNSALGVARAAAPQAEVGGLIHAVQRQLFAAGADLATPAGAGPAIPRLADNETAWLETEIDRMTAVLPPLRAFILPGGTPAAAHIHLARSIARRAERDTLRLATVEPIHPELPVYLNRLSDFLFTLARFENFLAGCAEDPWIPRA
ncbi:MAG: cob(I)yrinic acid a,c-diamide adenosyltransferase [Terrimicrobiaceae bacterium]|nr:cob(I)yrinic acid a,c-diamide adenosyltransferase [Terrimicrobiaceae bacterium]